MSLYFVHIILLHTHLSLAIQCELYYIILYIFYFAILCNAWHCRRHRLINYDNATTCCCIETITWRLYRVWEYFAAWRVCACRVVIRRNGFVGDDENKIASTYMYNIWSLSKCILLDWAGRGHKVCVILIYTRVLTACWFFFLFENIKWMSFCTYYIITVAQWHI